MRSFCDPQTWLGQPSPRPRGDSDVPPKRTQRPRQEPVSCESCRKKKLKCNREQPCSNCQTRGVACDFQDRKVPLVASASSSSPGVDEAPALRAENAAIKARIDRLEEIIFSGEVEARPAKARRLLERERPANGLGSPSTTLTNSPESEMAKNYKGDVQWLEGVGKSYHNFSSTTLIRPIM